MIDSSTDILLAMHERMDGDDGGALLALGGLLESQGKRVTYAIKKGVSPALAFLPGSEKIQDDIIRDNFDLLVIFGCSVIERTGSASIKNLPVKIINIDHHPDNTEFGHVNLVDPAKSSVAELVYDFFHSCGWPIGKETATCLLTGIITDTGSFMYSNTAASTLRAAAELLRRGAQVHKIIGHTFKGKTPQMLKAWGLAMENTYYDQQHRVIYSVMTDEDLAAFRGLPQSAFEGFVETLNTVPEAKFAMFLRQDGPVIKGSLRSDPFKNIDVAQIAHSFGGGGHK
ncbi:MAG TPA: DHH family phosphoesterase, partial [Patescibacteria group bacterium]|nr:DHH family phosphoesterase [Patescibacteria group bacterium]